MYPVLILPFAVSMACRYCLVLVVFSRCSWSPARGTVAVERKISVVSYVFVPSCVKSNRSLTLVRNFVVP